ncbi:hypothetical protein ACWEF6_21120 [Amycolatopsis sp. NPDC004772]
MVVVVAIALVLGCVALARRRDRLRAPLADDHGLWLPAVTERDSQGMVDFAVETARLRSLVLRSMGLVVLWVAVLAGVVAGAAAMGTAADHLLKTGVRVTGEVLGAYRHSRGEDTLHVAYRVGASDLRFADITWDSGREYVKGQQITSSTTRPIPAACGRPTKPTTTRSGCGGWRSARSPG